jgi:NADH-quinone oxidoreductase subunit L
MAGDNNVRRYFAMLGLFTFAMFWIVMSGSLFVLFMAWELVGFSSYMLIGHWNEKLSASTAARKAFIMNRVGDLAFLAGLMIVFSHTGTLDIEALEHIGAADWKTLAALCLFGGVVGKSAQFPLTTWLPDAMAGPTPVSALIHAATMVAAGVYLVVRLHFMFTDTALMVVTCIGMGTALLGASCALIQTDIKKILAYSTISQLGLMVMACGAGAFNAALTHLLAHAFFKAGLFLGAGSIIHALHQAQHEAHVYFDPQDTRNLGGLGKKMPVTFFSFVVCGSALAGLPLFSGFLSKEAILSSLFAWHGNSFSWKSIVVCLAFLVTFLTTIYTFRLVWKIFMGDENTTRGLMVKEAPPVMRAPIIILACMSLWFVLSLNPFDYKGWLYHAFHQGEENHFIWPEVLSVGVISVALMFAWLTRHRSFESKFLLQHFYLDEIYRKLFTQPSMMLSEGSAKVEHGLNSIVHFLAYCQVTIAYVTGWFDRTIVNGTVDGIAGFTRTIGSFTRSFQGGKIQLYVFWAVFAIIIFIIWSLI